MAKSSVTQTDRTLADLERQLSDRSILNFDCWATTDGRQLAENLRAVTELASLAFAGLCAKVKEEGLDTDRVDMEIVRDVLSMASQGAFVLAGKLGEKAGAA